MTRRPTDAVVLRRPAGAGALGALDGDLEVAAGGQLVEVVAGDVGVQTELLGDLRRGDARRRARGRTGRCRAGSGSPNALVMAETVAVNDAGAIVAPGGFVATPVFYLST